MNDIMSIYDNQYIRHIMYRYTDYYHLRIQEFFLLENNSVYVVSNMKMLNQE